MGAGIDKKASEESGGAKWAIVLPMDAGVDEMRAKRVASQSRLFVLLMGAGVNGLEIGMTSGNTCSLIKQ